jgi:hypothetical protein
MRSMSRALIIAVLACSLSDRSSAADDPLPSWNDTATRREIIGFVKAVTDAKTKSYVKPENRIATFDNDGTLWCEKPMCIHTFAEFERFGQLIAANPKLKSRQPYRAVSAKDMEYFTDLYEKGQLDTIVSDLFGVAFAGMTKTMTSRCASARPTKRPLSAWSPSRCTASRRKGFWAVPCN